MIIGAQKIIEIFKDRWINLLTAFPLKSLQSEKNLPGTFTA
jgi:hypothetical protein